MALLPKVKLKSIVSFPATILDGVGVDVVKQNGTYQFNIAFDDFAPAVSGLPPADFVNLRALLWNETTKAYALTPVSLFGSPGGIPDAPVDGAVYGRQSAAWAPIVGAAGPAGPAGPAGSVGPTGPPGEKWFTGSGDPVAVSGAVNGDWYLDSVGGNFWELVTGAWAIRGSLVGPPGPAGSGTGNVNGPISSVTDDIATYANTTGTLLKDGGKKISDLALLTQVVRYDAAQSLTATQQTQARQNVYAAPFDALAYNGMQINGSMEVSQENGTAHVSFTTSAAKYVVDGWTGACTLTGGGKVDFYQQPLPTEIPGLTNCLQIGIATAQASIGADFVRFTHRIEGYRFSRVAWGTANAQAVTVGFWVRAALSGTYRALIGNSGLSSTTAWMPFTVAGGAAFQWVTITFPPQTTGTWQTSNSTGAEIFFEMGSSATVNILSSTSNYASITGVVVLPGIEAPSAARSALIMRPYDQELLTCRRYFYNGCPSLKGVIGGSGTSTSLNRMSARHPVNMRSPPTLALIGTIAVFDGVVTTSFGSLGGNSSTADALETDVIAAVAMTSGRTAHVFQGGGGSISVDARL